MKNLKRLELLIPSIELLSTKTIMGGDGYFGGNDDRMYDGDHDGVLDGGNEDGYSMDGPTIIGTHGNHNDNDLPDDDHDVHDDHDMHPDHDQQDDDKDKTFSQKDFDQITKNMPSSIKAVAQKVFSRGGFVWDGKTANPQYNPDDGKIHLSPNASSWQMDHELVHYLQNQYGDLNVDSNSHEGDPNSEYQAYLINAILGHGDSGGFPDWGYDDDKDNEVESMLSDHVSCDEDGNISVDQEFMDWLNNEEDQEQAIEDFIDYWNDHGGPDTYTIGGLVDYDYDWEHFFDDFGIDYPR